MDFHATTVRIIKLVLLLLLAIPPLATSESISKPGCPDRCGNVSVPYPFGQSGCSLNRDFLITCNNSFNPPRPFLEESNLEITNITVDGHLHIMQFRAEDCYNQSGSTDAWDAFLTLAKFTISKSKNKFTVIGCDSYGFLSGYRDDKNYTAGCISVCENRDFVDEGSCSGGGCCQIEIPDRLYGTNVSAYSFNNHSDVLDYSPCTYAFIVEHGKFNFSSKYLKMDLDTKFPLVLDWEIEYAKNKSASLVCKDHAKINKSRKSFGYRCICDDGYKGNPYLGCHDINECNDKSLNDCTHTCVNLDGSYKCTCPQYWYHGDGRKGAKGCVPRKFPIIMIFLGVGVGFMVILLSATWLYFASKRRKLFKLKEKFFRENGGLLLQEELSKREGTFDAVRIFSEEELKKATDNYDASRIVGRGGFGIVYRGSLANGREVAIKKSAKVDQTQIEPFINEVVVLSQINHRNVVKLLGCCLETEVPLLVYEFISHGTLFDFIHKENDSTAAFQWETRLRIAAGTAGALSYLHSAASIEIIHRDVKTANILLDANYTAKVSDFGASRLVPDRESHIATIVQGTLGYLDPEYLRTSQLTEKSDVYGFGVVLAELLTAREALSINKPEKERNLSAYFVSCLKQGCLFEILDDRIISEECKEQYEAVARLAMRCLELKGDDRPTMKEVATELETLRSEKIHVNSGGHNAFQGDLKQDSFSDISNNLAVVNCEKRVTL